MALLGIEMALGNYIIKPIYLILGIFFFIGLVCFLVLVYGYLLVKKALKDTYNNIQIERKRYFNNK